MCALDVDGDCLDTLMVLWLVKVVDFCFPIPVPFLHCHVTKYLGIIFFILMKYHLCNLGFSFSVFFGVIG